MSNMNDTDDAREAKISEHARETKTINGVIKRVVFQNIESGFTILNIFSNGKFITASGAFFDKPIIDSKIKLNGEFTHHKKYGYQFNFTRYEISLSNTKTAIIEYLSSNIFKGIGKVIAGEIYEKFKEKTLDIIDNEPEKLKEINGIGAAKLRTILEGLKESYGLRNAVMFFKPYQFSDYQIKTIYNQFKDKSIIIAKENPYLFTEIKGIGFKKADIMAEKLGIKRDDPNRAKEAIRYVINQICESSGNSYVYYKDIRDGMKEIIDDLEEFNLKNYLNDLIKEEKILLDFKGAPGFRRFTGNYVFDLTDVKDDNKINYIKIYLPVYYYCELGVAKELKRITGNNVYSAGSENQTLSVEDLDRFIEQGGGQGENKILLTEEQKIAVLNALKYKISIISGGPGTGKSTVIRTIVNLYKGKKTALTSLSGKAAQRLSDIVNFGYKEYVRSDVDISTIHRLLKAQYDRQTNESFFTCNKNNKLPHDLIVIDEMSMVDIVIFYNLLKAVKDGAILVLVGDVNQIPSVSPGDVLRDLIYSDAAHPHQINAFFPVTFLTKVFRQNEGGLINLNAHNLLNNKRFITSRNNNNNGKGETIAAGEGGSFIIKYRREYDAASGGKNELLKDFIEFAKRVSGKRINNKTGNIDKADNIENSATAVSVPTRIFDDIQILTPMRKGDLGYFNLNNILQNIFNPMPVPAAAEDVFICSGVQFRLYDKVIQKRNNYDLDVFNGDAGYIINIDHTAKSLTVDFSNYGSFAKDKYMPESEAKKQVKYDFLDAYDNISLAYALSIHKAQGSEFNNVIILFHQAHYLMLKKNLLYTAITRGKKNVVIFGTFKAFSIAMRSKEEIRNSGLRDRLLDEFSAIT
ncbi:MAG: ATP-dependent RecD-like DNA helicase [Deltaproteobacteria bacterium]|nr:ATP-dependent RecD-like DNA helicase [Deltaproteobacteria bacterium]